MVNTGMARMTWEIPRGCSQIDALPTAGAEPPNAAMSRSSVFSLTGEPM